MRSIDLRYKKHDRKLVMPINYIDIGISFIETLSIMLVVLALNWFSTQIIAPNLTIKKIREINESTIDSDDCRRRSIKCIQDLEKEKKLLSTIWGPELSCASIGLYFAILGVWTSKEELFSLSNILGVAGTSMDVVIWISLFIFYLLIMALSIYCKELYIESPKETISNRKLYLNVSNYLGAFSMLSLIYILKYATSLG